MHLKIKADLWRNSFDCFLDSLVVLTVIEVSLYLQTEKAGKAIHPIIGTTKGQPVLEFFGCLQPAFQFLQKKFLFQTP